MWTKLAAKELVDGYRALQAAKVAPLHVPVASNGWQLQGTNKATLLADAQACFDRAKLFRKRGGS